jgi:hypothetical protein
MENEKKITKAHDQFETLHEVIHYEDHDKRTESAEFRRVKKELHANHTPCWINNGRCEGDLEVHHNIIEYSASTEVDWDKIHADYPEFVDVDCGFQMRVLCEKHHRGIGTGIHKISYPAWILQKYLKPEALEKFEKAVDQMISQGHDEQNVNQMAKHVLLNTKDLK